MPTAKFLGTADDVTSCDCCGRTGLKSTVALSLDDGAPVYYGVTCAARALSVDAKAVRSETRKADRENETREKAARDAAERARTAPWFAFLAASGTGGDDFTRIESLGGYKAARAAYEQGR